MHHFFRIMAFVGLTCLAVTTPAAADPISITSGFIVVTSPDTGGLISIAGTRGFSIEGVVDASEGVVDPFICIPCPPGETISVGANLSGSAVVGTATLDGIQYELTGSLDDLAAVVLELVGTAMLPQLVSPTVLTAPFSIRAPFSRFIFDTLEGGFVPLNGSGIVSLSLSPDFGAPDFWRVDQVRYDFNVQTPVPEPSTLTLITLGLAATLRARMRRRGDKA